MTDATKPQPSALERLRDFAVKVVFMDVMEGTQVLQDLIAAFEREGEENEAALEGWSLRYHTKVAAMQAERAERNAKIRGIADAAKYQSAKTLARHILVLLDDGGCENA